jgi:hypothetical protein
MITVTCTCGETYHADKQHVGRRIQCRCGKVLEIVIPVHPRDIPSPQEPLSPSASKPPVRPTDAYPRRTSKLTARRWVVFASVAGILLLFWGVYRFGNPLQENSSATFRSSVPAISGPTATVQPVLPPCPSEEQVRPRSGAELGGRYRGGLGRLRVANGTGLDAVAVLIDDPTEAPRRAIFIRRGESGSMTSVPPGRYRLRFQIGSDWLTERRFCRPRGTSEFDSAFHFDEFESGRGTKYSAYEVTLHPVPQGTARTHVVSDSQLELPPP